MGGGGGVLLLPPISGHNHLVDYSAAITSKCFCVSFCCVSSGSTIGETLHRTDAECLTLITLEILFFLNIIYIILFFKLNMAAITLTKY